MSTKKQEIINNVYYEKENISSKNKESNDYFLSKSKGFVIKKCYLILKITYLFLLLYFYLIANFLITSILNYFFERNFFNLAISFVELILHNFLFIILQNNIFVSESNTIEIREKKRISFKFPQTKIFVKNINHLKSFFGITKCIILLNLFNTIFVNNRIHLIEYNITLKIKGTGTKYIFSSNSKFPNESYPDEVYINGDKQNNVSYSYNFNQIDNNVGLVWYNLISNCDNMFRGCSSITEIDFSNFNTSNVDNMESFFYGCSKLISLNLSNFDTSKVTKMNGMFYECSLLTSLNLSNFDTSKVEVIDHMFFGCSNLEYINMMNFNEMNISNDSLKYRDIFYNVPENIVVCITKANILNKIYPQINNKSCLIEDCEEDWRLKQRKLDLETTELFINGSGIKYENDGQCYSICFYGYINHYDNNIFVKCKCELEKCLECPRVAFNNKLCSQCNENYYPMENDPLNLGEYIN